MRHRHEVVLAADARHHAAVLEPVRHRRAERGRHHAAVEEARLAPLQALERFVAAVEFVDLADAPHADAATGLRVVGQRRAASRRTPASRGRTRRAGTRRRAPAARGRRRRRGAGRSRCISATSSTTLRRITPASTSRLKPSLIISLQPYRPSRNGPSPPLARTAGCASSRRVQRRQHPPVRGVVGVPQRQRVAQRVGQRADADLQRAAVAHQRAGMEADRVVGIADRLPRQAEQLRVRSRAA